MKQRLIGSADAKESSRIIRLLMTASPPFKLLNVAMAGSNAYAFLEDSEERDPKVYLESHPEDPKVIFNFITAASREYNLPRMLHDLEKSLSGTEALADVNWIIVFDDPGPQKPYIDQVLKEAKLVKVVKAIYSGERIRYGIRQKNLGFDLSDERGYCTILDDDNTVHPDFIKRMTEIIRQNPRKRAFIYDQKRLVISEKGFQETYLKASIDFLKPCCVDNTQFLVHKGLMGSRRHDYTRSGLEDFYFIREIFDASPEEFAFIEETLAFYNYLNIAKSTGVG